NPAGSLPTGRDPAAARRIGGRSSLQEPQMTCQSCGVEAPTRYVEFHQNIGALVMRFSKSIKGNLCKRCIHRYFWQFTGINLVLGWWGLISFVMNIVFIGNNI